LYFLPSIDNQIPFVFTDNDMIWIEHRKDTARQNDVSLTSHIWQFDIALSVVQPDRWTTALLSALLWCYYASSLWLGLYCMVWAQ